MTSRSAWDAPLRSERLPLLVHQARFLILEQMHTPKPLPRRCSVPPCADLPAQWEQLHGYQPLLAETLADPESRANTCYKAAGWKPPVSAARTDVSTPKRSPPHCGPKNSG